MITPATLKLFSVNREGEKKHLSEIKKAKSQVSPLDPLGVEEEVCPDPLVLLRLEPHECRHVLELELSHKGLTRVHPNLQRFTNLEELWLKENKLKKLTGLLPEGTPGLTDGARGCARLKRLYLGHNQITSLAGSDVTRLRYLEVLLLSHNRLQNLELVSAQLQPLKVLRQLDLFGNPLAEEQNYRLFVVSQHPQVTLFDQQSVADAERREAAKLFGGGAAQHRPRKDAFGTHVPPAKPLERVPAISASAMLVEASVKQTSLRKAAAAQREEARAETELHERAERRRLFHSLWTKKGDTIPATTDRHVCEMFTADSADPRVGELIELARQREIATSDKRRAEIDAEIQRKKHLMFPERGGDGFKGSLLVAKTATKVDDDRAYNEQALAQLFSGPEHDAFLKAFEGGAARLHRDDVTGLLSVAHQLGSLDEAAFTRHVHAAMPDKATTVDLREAMRLLAEWPPFVALRGDQLVAESRAQLSGGHAAASHATYRRASFARDHLKRIERRQTATPPPGSAVEEMLRRHGRPAARDSSDDDA